ncbi:serine/threonine protein kinase [Pendulispora albinea]|uniref:non-specific serine/threonine protein kinase n=1 Tax=Pendulispora albinea TaxID=2741071 RepID=A0ABZ2LQI3_9BACT
MVEQAPSHVGRPPSSPSASVPDNDDPFGWVGHTLEGRYAVEELVGEGGFAIVYRGHHKGLDDAVAIKCLKIPRKLQGPERDRFLQSFLDEGKLLHRLSRANASIVQALDVGATTSPNGTWTPYLVLEWLDGETLEEDLKARARQGSAPRSLEETMALLEPAARALATAHAQGIAHRDVKPANLFLCTVAGKRAIKVVDFGIAKVIGESTDLQRAHEATGMSLHAFTPRYGAPEQFDRRFGATGPWTDVFALALIVVEVVAGRSPMHGDSAQLFVASSNVRYRPTLRSLDVDLGEVDDAVEAVLLRALAVDPKERYTTAGEFWDALTAAIAPSAARTLAHGGAASSSRIERDEARASSPARASAPARGATVDPLGATVLSQRVPDLTSARTAFPQGSARTELEEPPSSPTRGSGAGKINVVMEPSLMVEPSISTAMAAADVKPRPPGSPKSGFVWGALAVAAVLGAGWFFLRPAPEPHGKLPGVASSYFATSSSSSSSSSSSAQTSASASPAGAAAASAAHATDRAPSGAIEPAAATPPPIACSGGLVPYVDTQVGYALCIPDELRDLTAVDGVIRKGDIELTMRGGYLRPPATTLETLFEKAKADDTDGTGRTVAAGKTEKTANAFALAGTFNPDPASPKAGLAGKKFFERTVTTTDRFASFQLIYPNAERKTIEPKLDHMMPSFIVSSTKTAR